jgi:hypothetical protein
MSPSKFTKIVATLTVAVVANLIPVIAFAASHMETIKRLVDSTLNGG